MKLKYLLFFIIIGIATFYLYQDTPLKTRLLSKFNQVVPELNQSQSTLYKWQNEKGEWQVTDKPPAKGITFTSVSSKDQVNVMPGTAIK